MITIRDQVLHFSVVMRSWSLLICFRTGDT